MVVNSIMLENNTCLMLAVLDLEIDRSDIHLNSVDGPKIEVLTLPYSH